MFELCVAWTAVLLVQWLWTRHRTKGVAAKCAPLQTGAGRSLRRALAESVISPPRVRAWMLRETPPTTDAQHRAGRKPLLPCNDRPTYHIGGNGWINDPQVTR